MNRPMNKLMNKLPLSLIGFLVSATCVTALAQQPALDHVDHTVVQGDTLIGLAHRYFDDATQWLALQRANPSIRDPRRLQPGSLVRVPALGLPGPVAVHVSGQASFTRLGQKRTLAQGDELRESDMVDVQPQAYVTLRWPEGIVTHLLPGTAMKILPPPGASVQARNTKAADTSQAPRARLMQLQTGIIESRVPPGVAGTNYQVRTRLGTAAVRGTQFGVRLPASSAMVTEVSEGSVQLAGSGYEPLAVPAGTGAVADGSARQPQAVAMLAAPGVDATPVLTPESNFEAAAVAGAANYEFEIAPAAQPDAVLRRASNAAPSFALPRVADGSYRTTIRAVDAQGIPGRPAVSALTVITLASPFISEPRNDAVLGQGLPTRLVCSEVPNATRYEIVIRDAAAPSEPVRVDAGTSCQAALPRLPLGRYEWRATSLRDLPGGKVLRSVPSPASRFTIAARPPAPSPSERQEGSGVRLRWEAVTGANYVVQVARDADFKSLVSENKVAEPETLLRLPTGAAFFVRIRTIDAAGLPSDFSPARIVRGPAWLGSSDGAAVRDSSGAPLVP